MFEAKCACINIFQPQISKIEKKIDSDGEVCEKDKLNVLKNFREKLHDFTTYLMKTEIINPICTKDVLFYFNESQEIILSLLPDENIEQIKNYLSSLKLNVEYLRDNTLSLSLQNKTCNEISSLILDLNIKIKAINLTELYGPPSDILICERCSGGWIYFEKMDEERVKGCYLCGSEIIVSY
jgi:hypothetical protein